ncbi:MAG TPA: hypothetical protein VHL09_11875, partial [Dehalococcoidia bacterium]|nr:hypothetical protein [Dehalococcoidia bacterium]
MMRSIVLGVVVLLAVVTLVATAGLPQGNPNAFIVLYFVELLLVPAVGVLGLAALLIRPGSAPGLVGAGSYALLVGA